MKVVSKSVKNIFPSWLRVAQNQIDDYDKTGDYSTTQLVGPPRISYLTSRHYDSLEVDVISRVDLIMGSAVHYVLEMAADKDTISEQRFKIPILGKLISMKPDIATVFSELPSGHKVYAIHDFKFVKANSVKYGVKMDWECQLNCYAYGMRAQGYDVRHLSVEYMIKDWSAIEYAKDKANGYPKDRIGSLAVNVWTEEKCKQYLESRVNLFESVKDVSDAALPFCTRGERWMSKSDVYVVKKRDSSRALPKSSFPLKSDAVAAFNARKDKVDCEIQFRPCKSTRCEWYCDVKHLCNQYQDFISKDIDPSSPF